MYATYTVNFATIFSLIGICPPENVKPFYENDSQNATAELYNTFQNLPLLGMEQWVELSKKKRNVHVFLSLGTSKDVQEACSEHRQLTRVMVRNQLRTAASPFAWKGELSGAAEQILLLHRAHTSLDEQHALLARWAGYCDYHEDSPFNFQALEAVLRKLLELQANEEKCFGEKEVQSL